jgi:hypothetical protein
MKLNIVPARLGAQWVKEGVLTFFRQPIALTGLFLMFLAIVSLISLLPWIGGLVGLIFVPAATLGLMAAAQEANAGKFPRPLTLFSAFRVSKHKSQQMLLLGLLYMVGFLLLLGLSALVDSGSFAKGYLVGGTLTKETVMQVDFQRAMWIALVLYIPFSSLFWHASALVHWHGISIAKSLFFSCVACFSNWRAFVVYAASWMSVFALMAVLLGLVSSSTEDAEWVSELLLPFLLVLGSMFFTSAFFSFRDSFSTDPILA